MHLSDWYLPRRKVWVKVSGEWTLVPVSKTFVNGAMQVGILPTISEPAVFIETSAGVFDVKDAREYNPKWEPPSC